MSRPPRTEEQTKAAVAALEAVVYRLGRHRRHPWSKTGPCVYCDTCGIRLYQGEPLTEQEKAELPDTKCAFTGCGMPLQFDAEGWARHLTPPPEGIATHTPHYDVPGGPRVIDLTEMDERQEGGS